MELGWWVYPRNNESWSQFHTLRSLPVMGLCSRGLWPSHVCLRFQKKNGLQLESCIPNLPAIEPQTFHNSPKKHSPSFSWFSQPISETATAEAKSWHFNQWAKNANARWFWPIFFPVSWIRETELLIPSRELTYPTWGKRTSSSKVPS